MPTLFTKIILGEIQAHKVAETDEFLAFLDIHPLRMGHVLVIPKTEIDYIFDMPDALYANMMLFAKIVAKAIKIAIPCTKVGVAVIGLEVPHTHIHLIPMDSVADMDFSQAKLNPTDVELNEIALKILNAMRKI
ncbi:MAG: HIT family protein [Sphingobacteriales bacterium]|nr:MAG: HIT family protein [Sphingobacteriales bacterium]TAF80860.1 MAG: HIT family protein [Sphingobacteriales bacterium]